jgi:hypothetical protein
LHLLLELLVAILQLLDPTCEFANGRFQSAEPGDEVRLGHLRPRLGGEHAGKSGYKHEQRTHRAHHRQRQRFRQAALR